MSFKVIDGDRPGSGQWQREVAENQFSWALREAAANLMQIAGGRQSNTSMLQFDKVMSTALALYQLSGSWPIDIIGKVLPLETVDQRYQDRLREGRYNRADLERWLKDGSTDRLRAEHMIVRGALQLAASELVQQATQPRGGHRELYDGVEWLERLQTEPRRKGSNSSRKRSARRRSDAADDL
ncbi:hypothetical protein SAMN05216338_1001366 [Bradyrhizobium sp. Rc2d]|uniref:hypothetical protein n=1 Tax=Bradyrhizobium sp. Rc2d TaxID=1855321 RepID=UPI00087F42D7|nr:hypothetical protein [Bradyrhizobium sp. Rc2d]SDG45485.1 hypothetical protein SAMN05216338_1001366 [Bradyrhizobium sp. Rc2d]